ncbi:hypothetical protein [Amycolatopsis sp. NBC_00438]|uniref:hypothetical protein n=1 Tax=Amycolatopsis sp. NBC_00438 TaxID=2903558 RepID=UPI002E2477C0
MDRRNLLKITAGTAVAAAGSVLLGGTADAETTSLSPVPGMLGDRRANELWYQLDEIALYHPSAETSAAYTALFGYLGQESIASRWLAFSKETAYPRNYLEFVKPVEAPLRTLSKLQLGNFDRFYRGDEAGLVKAFADFGQGVLFDPRREPVESEVHTMDGNPPSSYHFWHAIQRAQMLLGIDRPRWSRIDPMLGFAWALQSVAKPDHRHVNPGLPAGQIRAFARYWLPREPAQLDHDFQSSPYPSGLG